MPPKMLLRAMIVVAVMIAVIAATATAAVIVTVDCAMGARIVIVDHSMD